MTLDSDLIIERRRLRRRVSLWRVLSFLLLAVILVALLWPMTPFADGEKSSAHIARIDISGTIVEDRRVLEMIRKIGENDAVEGVIVAVNSRGGTTTGGEALFEALRELSESKPVVSTIGTVGASAGYLTAIAADHVIARYNSMTGSIGVLLQYGNAQGLLETIGVEMDAVKSSPLKAEPNFYSPASDEARAVLESMVNDSYEWFVALVAERRNLSEEEARKVSNGQVYSGNQALQNKLIDSIGGEEAAVAWLETEQGVTPNLKVVDWAIREDRTSGYLPFSIAGITQDSSGSLIESLAAAAKNLAGAGVSLDGLVSVWQAPQAADHFMRGEADSD
ncbi:signal peptide peptidase SppA [Rhodobacteraceae bacterium RKSG542]|uniref:signal peptide peptidase SppA n=1 Tax=Pseudovibrio flavus TaxID=2529854 RepID=UPI0012BB9538|nr:signal peptide peptidase SppA [Pseudovibrio flavus]MTI17794.1 signal peptide peptidase SppA [Pseudovibrio flavus]